jgi:cold shock CspA family protein
MHGRIERLIHSHGYGFIHADNGQEVFFHRADLLEIDFHHLKEGQKVEFFLPDRTAKDILRAVIVRPERQHRPRG